jgi:hypothetical protein
MGIRTYADLANIRQHTAEEVSAALKSIRPEPPAGIDQYTGLTRQAEMLSHEEFQEQAEKQPSAAGRWMSRAGVGVPGGVPRP